MHVMAHQYSSVKFYIEWYHQMRERCNAKGNPVEIYIEILEEKNIQYERFKFGHLMTHLHSIE